MIDGIDHIAIAVNSLEETLPFYVDSLGMTLTGIEEVPDQKVKVAFLEAGGPKIELLEPTSEDSPISKFLAKNGPGLHHIALATTDLQHRLDGLKANGVRLIDEKARVGAEGKGIAFVHPKATKGVLLELCTEGDSHHE